MHPIRISVRFLRICCACAIGFHLWHPINEFHYRTHLHSKFFRISSGTLYNVCTIAISNNTTQQHPHATLTQHSQQRRIIRHEWKLHDGVMDSRRNILPLADNPFFHIPKPGNYTRHQFHFFYQDNLTVVEVVKKKKSTEIFCQYTKSISKERVEVLKKRFYLLLRKILILLILKDLLRTLQGYLIFIENKFPFIFHPNFRDNNACYLRLEETNFTAILRGNRNFVVGDYTRIPCHPEHDFMITSYFIFTN